MIYYLEMWILMVQVVKMTVKLTLYSKCNIPVSMQLNEWVRIMCSTDDWTSVCLISAETISITVD